jgi:LmbE family N-acetylglucosaminyl deacetylase
MRALRRKEQEKAAILGQYSAVVQLDYPSATARNLADPNPGQDLHEIFSRCVPDVVYTHNPADKHETHVAVTLRVIRAIRKFPADKRPKRMYGCEVWRGLDWMPDRDRVGLDVGADPALAKKLLRTFASQVEGKSFVDGTIGRRQGNATFDGPREHDRFEGLTYAMDLTPLIKQDELNVADYVMTYIERFKEDVAAKLRQA